MTKFEIGQNKVRVSDASGAKIICIFASHRMTLGKGVYRSRRATDPVCSDTRSRCSAAAGMRAPWHKRCIAVLALRPRRLLRARIPPAPCAGRPGRASASVCFPTKLPIYEIGVTSALASANQQLRSRCISSREMRAGSYGELKIKRWNKIMHLARGRDL